MMKHVLSLILAVFVLIPSQSQPGKQDLQKIDETVKRAFSEFGTTGISVAVTMNDKVIYSNALGYADAEKKEVLKSSHLFNIASCSKAFTAAAVAMLVDEGKLRWSDKVTDYFPEFRLADDYITRELTVEDLLCHRSGLGTFFGDLLWYNSSYSDEEVMRRIRFEPVTRRFGIQYGYQNIMFLVAGKIVEKVSGMTWSQFVTERIFTPLGMSQTRPSNDELVPGQAIAYGHIGKKPLEILDFNAAKSAAGIYSSVDELVPWTVMMLNRGTYGGKRLLSEGAVDRLMEPHTIIGASASQKQHGINFYTYGMGWYVSDYNGARIVEHDGGMPGYISKVLLVPSMKISIIILNNGNDYFVNSALKGDLLDILVKGREFDWTGEYMSVKARVEQAQKSQEESRIKSRIQGTQPSHKPEEYTGTFRDKSYGDAMVKLDKGRLNLTFLPAAETFTSEMEHWHYDTWKVVFRDEFLTFGLVTFSFDASGKATGFKIDLPSEDFHFWNLDFRKVDR